MCWNPDISINTFLFGCHSLIFIFFANTYTKYKLENFDNPLLYLFLFEISLMQLLEFFIWRNLKNKSYNRLLSMISMFLIFLQMFTLIIMIPDTTFRSSMLILFAIFTLLYSVYRYTYNQVHFHTSVAKNGHLSWDWMNFKGYESIWLFIFLLFYLIPMYFFHDKGTFWCTLIVIAISLYYYFKENTFGSMWCWLGNMIFFSCLINILIVKPYLEKGLC